MIDLAHLQRYGNWALVAGSAIGLGRAFCDALAQQGFHLIMIDNDSAALSSASLAIASKYRVETRILACDLQGADSNARLMREISLKSCRLVIFNAAYGTVKPFTQNSSEELDTYIDLNCRAPLKLAHAFAQHHLNKDRAAMLIMSSQAGLYGTRLIAPYAASKAFDWNLAESLSYEYSRTNLDFLAVCPRAIATPNFYRTNPVFGGLTPKPSAPEYIANTALRRIGKDRRTIPGMSGKAAQFVLARLLPRRWAGNLVNRAIVKMYPNSSK